MEQQLQTGGVICHSRSKIVEGKKKTYYWFTVNARNNKVLVTSETYKTKQAMEKGIYALQSFMENFYE